IPEEWSIIPLEDATVILDSRRIPLSEKDRKDRRGPFPYCGANGIIDYIDSYIFDEEAVLLAEDGGNYMKFGNSAYLMSGKYWVNNHAHIIKAKDDLVSNRFILYWLNFYDISTYVSGSTRAKLNQESLRKIPLCLPPFPEQQKIAEILTTADRKIELIDQEILAAERVKKGLMQTLLTKGIGHTKFKMTEIGEMPEEWELKNLGDSEVSQIKMGQSPPSTTYNKAGNGLPFLQGNAEFGFKYPSFTVYCNLPLKTTQPGDVLISVRAPVGAVNIANLEYCIGRGLAAIRPNPRNTDGLFLYYILNHLRVVLERISTGSTFKAIGKEQLHSLEIPFPKIAEQQKIAEILTTADRKIELLKEKKRKAESLKKGLMQVLLTGQVRVKVDKRDEYECLKGKTSRTP
ncbi:MAG: restriction endonuclease subunit S, partial [Candidatus Micrarchaeaceae archaeon]